MTAIAYRDGVLAADSAVFQGSICSGRQDKIRRLKGGRLVASSGRLGDSLACFEWLAAGALPEHRPPPVDKEIGFAALVVGPKPDIVVKIESDWRQFQAPEAEFWAIGCHYEFLLGAMAAGASALEAVRLACHWGDGAREPVQVEYVEEGRSWRD